LPSSKPNTPKAEKVVKKEDETAQKSKKKSLDDLLEAGMI
jgi:hypothetical protein